MCLWHIFLKKKSSVKKSVKIERIGRCKRGLAPVSRRTCLKNRKGPQNRTFFGSSALLGFGAPHQLWPNLA
jgi:hypothetical protein